MAKTEGAKTNGALWKVLIGVAATILAIGIAWGTLGKSVERNDERITKIEPEVQKNSDHRLQDEIDTQYVKKRLDNIETMQRTILDEVRK